MVARQILPVPSNRQIEGMDSAIQGHPGFKGRRMTRLEEAIGHAQTDWQRSLLQEWGRRNPKPLQIKAGHLGVIEIMGIIYLTPLTK
jgi:hypothetical protein